MGFQEKVFGDNDKTVIRAGFSRVYDRAGFALINSFDQIGSAGFSTTLQNPCCTFGETGAENLPRITGINAIPVHNFDGFLFLQPPPAHFPQVTPINSQANLWGTDNTLKTPHAYTADFSIGRELPHRFSLQVSYVGRFGRDLLTQRDLTQPLNAVSRTIENGFVHLPEQAEWLATYLHELVTFPKGKYDDQADSTSQALDWGKTKRLWRYSCNL
jgi:hypothetical protein